MVKRTSSIKIEETIWKEFKVKCIKDGRELSEYVESLLIKELKK
jgi:hypothetical protein